MIISPISKMISLISEAILQSSESHFIDLESQLAFLIILVKF